MPPEWEDESVELRLVRLRPAEIAELLDRRRRVPAVESEDLSLARLVARGLTTRTIAAELEIDQRTVQRHVARLRRRLGAGTKSELTALLAGSGALDDAPQNAATRIKENSVPGAKSSSTDSISSDPRPTRE